MSVYFDALLATAQMIACNRRGTDAGKSAHDWLAWLSTEHCVQFAMLTDAFDEVSVLLRFHDREACDPSEIAHAVSLFVTSAMSLFEQGNVVHLGFTAMVLQHLHIPNTFVLNGKPKDDWLLVWRLCESA